MKIDHIIKLAVLAVGLLLAGCTPTPHDVQEVDALPHIFPDYVDVTVPADIAPLNFNVVGDDVEAVQVTVKGDAGVDIVASGNGNLADFDIDEWRALLDANKGKALKVSVVAEHAGQWKAYKAFTINVSRHALEDYGLTYRRIAPGYEVYSKMGIYQRCLQTFDEEQIIENTIAPGACLNCHTSNATNPDQFTFHVRGLNGATMVQTGDHLET